MVPVPVEVITRFFASATLIKLTLGRQIGLNLQQMMTITLLGTTRVSTASDLKKRLSASGSSLTFTLDSLEKKGLIERKRNKRDRRQMFLSLSKKGDELLHQVLLTEQQAAASFLGTLTEAETAAFLNLSGQIEANAQKGIIINAEVKYG